MRATTGTTRVRRGLVLAALGAIVVLATASTIDATSPRAGGKDVMSRVGEFVDTDGARIDGPVIDGARAHFLVTSPTFASRIDAATGRLLSLTRSDAIPSGLIDKLGRDGAVEVATRFLTRHAIETTGMVLDGGFEDHGSFGEYLLTWQRWDGEVRVPDTRVVAINPASGEVFQYLDSRREYAKPPAAAIDKAQGTRIAQGLLAAGPASEVKYSELAVTFSESGEQSLVWEVGLTAENAGGWTDAYIVHVDAISGKAVIFAQG